MKLPKCCDYSDKPVFEIKNGKPLLRVKPEDALNAIVIAEAVVFIPAIIATTIIAPPVMLGIIAVDAIHREVDSWF